MPATINLKFPDNSERQFDSGVTGRDVAEGISKSLAKKAVAISLDGELCDLADEIMADGAIEIITRSDERALELIRHDCAHVLAEAVQDLWPETQVTIGPVIENGFYYDFARDTPFTPEDLPVIEKKMRQIIARNDKFTKEVWTREQAKAFFADKGETYKIELIDTIPEDQELKIYKQGEWADLCRGPHMRSTADIGNSFKLMSVAGAYWRGDSDNTMLTRIYGTAFADDKQLKQYMFMREEAEKRDHRKLGREMDLFHFQEEGPGVVFWHSKGWRLFQNLVSYMRRRQDEHGYEEVNAPQILDKAMWETSGHWEWYHENMFITQTEDDRVFAIKPMNCPFHIEIYKTKLRSYRDLPLRWAELGTVYRYEKSGVLHGLLRVRGFTQDDAHIFCSKEQIEDEIIEVIRFSNLMWKQFGFETLKYYVSTRPDKVTGNDELWEQATRSLEVALEKEGLEYEIDEGGGAFYGPKIDIKIKDALNREWQMSTIQFDFNLPERFNMKYIGEDGKEHRPFMVHRALLGSIERFMGVLIEHYGGAFPDWLAPVQVAVIPVSQNYFDYAQKIVSLLFDENIRVEFDKRNEKIGYKIRDWETQKTPYMLILGEKEMTKGTISVRKHKHGDQGETSIDEFVSNLKKSVKNKINNN
ncbi:MAG: threonine--tRNA ligase [Rhizobiaceae bacterium]|nr:threonine--tRNA ligase [Rhizobiaceae bacterium]